MIDDNGYLKMIDFGTAKVIKDYTSIIIGTPHYNAPEILQEKGNSLSCDFWILVFACLKYFMVFILLVIMQMKLLIYI